MSRTTIDRRTALLAMLASLCFTVGLAFALLPTRWIEALFEAGPDGGDGSFELLIALVPAGIGVVLGAIAVVRWRASVEAQHSSDVVQGNARTSL